MQYIQIQDVHETVIDAYNAMDDAKRRRIITLLSLFGTISAPYLWLLFDVLVLNSKNVSVITFTRTSASVVQWFYLLASLATIFYALWCMCLMFYRKWQGRGQEEEVSVLERDTARFSILSVVLKVVALINQHLGEKIQKKLISAE